MKFPECVCNSAEEYVQVALAIETLAYHNKNYLNSGIQDNARINLEVQSLLHEALNKFKVGNVEQEEE